MPELPDITVYVEALRPRVLGRVLRAVRVRGAYLLRTFDPPIEAAEGRAVRGVDRLGKRIVLALEGDLFLALHLMISGRLLWKAPGAKAAGKIDVAAFDFEPGTLVLTEAGTMKRAALHLLSGRAALDALRPAGLEPLDCTLAQFGAALRAQRRTLKRRLTDPSAFSGIGNAYSDEILHAAGLSPVRLTTSLRDDECRRLHDAARSTLARWTDRLRREFGLIDGAPGVFPGVGDITAFRPDFAVHGRFGKPCPVCGARVQRIVRAENEVNYCPRCQTGGKVLADRSLSRLLKEDWPAGVEEWGGD